LSQGGATFLSKIPAIQNGGDILRDVVDGIRAAVLEEDDGWFSRGEDGLDQVVLVAEKVEVVSIAGMVDGPGFAGGLLVSAERQDYEVCCRGNFGGFLDALGVERRIADYHFVGIPIGIGLGDLASEGVEDFRGGAYFSFDRLENADAATRLVAIPAQV
jgi:hypothetical protein